MSELGFARSDPHGSVPMGHVIINKMIHFCIGDLQFGVFCLNYFYFYFKFKTGRLFFVGFFLFFL